MAKKQISEPFPPGASVGKAEALIAKARKALQYRGGVVEARRLSAQVAEALVIPIWDPEWERAAEEAQEAVRKDEQRLWAEIEAASPPEIYSGMPAPMPGGPMFFEDYRGYDTWGGKDADGRWFAWLPGLEKYGFIGYRPSKADAMKKARKLIDYIESEHAKPERTKRNPKKKKAKGKKNPSRADILRRAMRGT